MKQKSKAPALAHGIEVLMYLSLHNQSSLEKIAQALDLPKSSLLRYMDTLVEYDLVQRSSVDKSYSLTGHFPTADDHVFKSQLHEVMSYLCTKTQCTTEWYELDQGKIVLKHQLSFSGHEIKITAAEGFVREFGPELEAVNRIFISHDLDKLPGTAHWSYSENHEHQSISLAKAKEQLAEPLPSYKDDYPNSNGIRRMAKAVYKDNQLLGVLALAQITFLPQVDTWENIFEQLKTEQLGD
ncbi:MAG: helix-turn-helix domain-containing protein [Lentisphaeria bacterium]|nr:helix-turn-helix domain-containing protein [Lentisphaeria bacterium]